jgi:hypothetical protein
LLHLFVREGMIMKKTIVFGSLLAVFLMLMIPNVSAVEYNTVAEAHESYIIQRFEITENELNELIESIKDGNIENFSIFGDILWGIVRLILVFLMAFLSGMDESTALAFILGAIFMQLILYIVQLIESIGLALFLNSPVGKCDYNGAAPNSLCTQ